MKAPPFTYIKPTTIDSCLQLLAEHGDEAQVIAGGQSLMPLLNLRLAAPSLLIDINGLGELRGIDHEQGCVRIGALERHADIARSETVRQAVPLLAAAAPHIAHVAVRERGTIGGSLALADPAAEWPAGCLALGAIVELTSTRGVRQVMAEDFFQGIYETVRQADELLTAVRFPLAGASGEDVFAFDELARRRGDFAIAGLALTARRAGKALGEVRLAFFGVADRPLLARGAMSAIEGRTLDDVAISAAAAALAGELDPPEDPAYPAAYRRRIAGVLLTRTLKRLSLEAQHGA
ncbi:MAG: FAD binding domain-containing protein [Hyphomicrobiaceae bacterium]